MTDDSPPWKPFPPYQNPLELIDKSVNPATKVEFDAYLRSACNDFVTLLKNLKCKQCDLPFSSNDREYPVIAYCGHYVHFRCIYDKEEKKKRRMKTPFICRDCLGKVNNDRCAIKGCTNLSGALKAFFAAIEEPGYECIGCGFDRHPENNVVRIIDNDTSTYPTYLCVWCCVQKKDYKRIPVRHLKPEDSVHIEKSTTGLCSLDRTFDIFGGIPNLQCCCCMVPLIDMSPKNIYEVKDLGPASGELDFLPCGHIRHKICENEGNVYCNLCRKRGDVEDVGGELRMSHIREYINPGNLVVNDVLFTAYHCKKCNSKKSTLHPLYNTTGELGKALCVWCAADERKEFWTKDEETRNREQNEDDDREGREEKKRQGRRSRSKSFKRISQWLRGKKKGDGTEGLLQ